MHCKQNLWSSERKGIVNQSFCGMLREKLPQTRRHYHNEKRITQEELLCPNGQSVPPRSFITTTHHLGTVSNVIRKVMKASQSY